jgi:hypothetical protein
MFIPKSGRTQPLCKTCYGAGRIFRSPSGLIMDLGVFCPDCDDGRQRWNTVLKVIDQCEPDRLTTVFVPRR